MLAYFYEIQKPFNKSASKTLSYIQCTVIYIFFPEIQNLAVSLILLLSRPLPPRLIEIENSGLKNFPMTPTWDRYYFKPRGSARARLPRVYGFSVSQLMTSGTYTSCFLKQPLGCRKQLFFPNFFFVTTQITLPLYLLSRIVFSCVHIFSSAVRTRAR